MTATKPEKKTGKKTASKTVAKKTVKAAAKAATVATKKSTEVTMPPTFNGTTTPLKKPSTTKHKMPDGPIVISRIATETLLVPILGISPLLTHNFSAKNKQMMLDAMQNRQNIKEPKDPEAEFEAAAYRFDDGGYGMVAVAFKSCTVSAARLFGKQLTMVMMRQALHVEGELSRKEGKDLVRINGEMSPFELTPQMREDVVRLSNRGTDLRYRPCWLEWETQLRVTYVKSVLAQESVLSLIDAGGMTTGVGEWRPEKGGDFGRFVIHPDRPIEVLG